MWGEVPQRAIFAVTKSWAPFSLESFRNSFMNMLFEKVSNILVQRFKSPKYSPQIHTAESVNAITFHKDFTQDCTKIHKSFTKDKTSQKLSQTPQNFACKCDRIYSPKRFLSALSPQENKALTLSQSFEIWL